jgi:hypothetical protein
VRACTEMRCPRTIGIGVGRQTCARSDLRIFVTYSQIFTVLGLQLLKAVDETKQQTRNIQL